MSPRDIDPAVLPAPVTSDATRLLDYLVGLAMQAVQAVDDEPLGQRGSLIITERGRQHLAAVLRERLAQAATTIVLELDEARTTRVGELTARQLGEWGAGHDVDGRPHLRCWRTEKGWHVSLSVMQRDALCVRTYEAVAPDVQDAWTMLMAGVGR